MKLIEATLIWAGGIGRKDLIKKFGISEIQSSKDLTHYQNFCPGNIEYDRSLKSYIPTANFRPSFLTGEGDSFLEALKAISIDNMHPTVVLLSRLPTTEVLKPPQRKVSSACLQKINYAIRNQRDVVITYQSMRQVTANKYTISPHALVFNGFRWHIRAYSHEHKDFRDFLLARIKGVPELSNTTSVSSSSDQLWEKWIDVKIGPHPGLSHNQKQVIEDDFGMRDGVLVKRIRAALVQYYVQLMRVHINDEKTAPEIQQIILLNKQEVTPYLF